MRISDSPTYRCWAGIVQRCTNPNNKSYPYYGGRGIVMCSRWRNSFKNFHEDMGDKPKDMTIDRINVNGDYEPSNCRWATRKEQSVNQRRVVIIDGLSLPDYCKKNGLKYSSVKSRVRRGWDLPTAISKPTKKEFSLKRYCIQNNLVYSRTKARLRYGWSFYDAVNMPVNKVRRYNDQQEKRTIKQEA